MRQQSFRSMRPNIRSHFDSANWIAPANCNQLLREKACNFQNSEPSTFNLSTNSLAQNCQPRFPRANPIVQSQNPRFNPSRLFCHRFMRITQIRISFLICVYRCNPWQILEPLWGAADDAHGVASDEELFVSWNYKNCQTRTLRSDPTFRTSAVISIQI